MARGRLGLSGGAVDLDRRIVDGRDELSQRLDGVINRIGDGAA
jgi:hypothetical protein